MAYNISYTGITMRFKLTLSPIHDRQRLLFNYQYPLQAWVYQLLANADADFASFLHSRGFLAPNSQKTFKHFTFSTLQIPHTEPIKRGDDCMVLRSPAIFLQLSFLIDKMAEDFIIGLFQSQQLSLYNQKYRADFVVERVETLPVPLFEQTMAFKTIAPMVVAAKTDGNDQYLSPNDNDFAAFFALNLLDKYRSIYPDALPQMDAQAASKLIRLRLLSAPEKIKMRGFTVKEGKTQHQTKVIGYHNFSFEVAAPAEILEVGYWSGFGKYNAMGCGACGLYK